MAFYSTPKLRLLATAAPAGLMAIMALPAAAQVANSSSSAAKPATDDQDADQTGDIVVTGTLFRTNKETPSPVTTITADDLDKRGINTVQDAVQKLSANGSGALPNSFSANGAFASGASAASLRGLTTSSTLVLFDGMRAAYYPLADDGTRNFVDLNSIPAAIIEKIDVVKDGASSTYGADAVAGVINIITKKQVKGLYLTGSAGVSQYGDLGEQRVSALYGYGDLDQQGFNVYVSGEYQKDSALYNRDRGYPYNTSDLSKLCGTSVGTATVPAGTTTCRTNSVQNGTQFDGTYAGTGTTIVPVVRAYDAATNATGVGRYQLLNASAGCRQLAPVTLTAAQQTSATTSAINNCLEDDRNMFSVIAPAQQRIGASARATFKLGSNTEAYGMFNYYRSDVFYTGTPQAVRANSAAGGAAYSTANIALPVYVCNRNGASASYINNVPQVAGCTAANGTLNPNNPFAASGQVARILYRLADIPLSNERLVQTYRGAIGFKGSIGRFNWDLEGTGMQEDLKATYKGYIYVQHLFDVIADGSYNFVNPAANTQAVRDYLAPTQVNNSRSKLYQVQGTIAGSLFDLPGGPFQVAVGAAYRYESVFAPSANPVVGNGSLPGNYNRYFTINGFGTSGSRKVESAFFEVQAPIVPQFEVNVSGRYDHYSSGQNNFSPKVGAKFTPIKEIALRGTFSKGFRIPSFAEAYGLPTTGYITQTPPANYQNSPACLVPGGGGAKYAYCTASYSLGLTSVGNPNLKPEKATNFTAGVIFEPIKNVSLSVDYYNIYKKDLITGADYAPQIALYYASATAAGTTLANGITGITQDANYLASNGGPYPLLSTIQYGFINANSAKSTGIDFDLETRLHLSPNLTWTSSLDANYVIELSTTINGVKQRYDDTLGAYQITSASGTPKWRATWSNTLDIGNFSLTATTYFTKGYELGAEDDGNVRGVCAAIGGGFGSYAVYRDGATIVRCRTNDFISMDLTATVRINDNFTIYGNMLNALGAKPPYDPSTYGASNYNPAWANSGIVGRYFRVGARVKM